MAVQSAIESVAMRGSRRKENNIEGCWVRFVDVLTRSKGQGLAGAPLEMRSAPSISQYSHRVGGCSSRY